jgi:hypothetical protein
MRKLIYSMNWEIAEENASLADHELEFARIWKAMPKIVFSRTLEQVEGNARLVGDGLAEEVAVLKQRPGGSTWTSWKRGRSALASSTFATGACEAAVAPT